MFSLILASASPYRCQLLTKLGIPFTTGNPNIDETPLPKETAEALVERLARTKAEALTASHPDSLIIGSDQVATFDGRIIGKPHTKDNAQKQLSRFSGQAVTFITGLALHNSRTGITHSLTERFDVRFRQLTKHEISNYLDREQPWDCAGSFKSEGLGITLFDYLSGRDPNTLIGLPLIALCDLLRAEGCNPLTQPMNTPTTHFAAQN